MKHQIARFSPHQNGKVAAVLMALVSLIFMVPFFLISSLFGMGQARAPLWIFIVLPVFYLVFTYIGVAVVCALYNVLVPFLGGVEYESGTGAS